MTLTLDEEIAGALASVESCLERLRAVHAIRVSEGKSISPARAVDARRLRDGLDSLIKELPADPDVVNEMLTRLQRVL